MIQEVCNALLITYVASEYLLLSSHNNNNNSTTTEIVRTIVTQKGFIGLLSVILFLNILLVPSNVAKVTRATDTVNKAFHWFLHLPRIIFAIFTFLIALYVDCSKQNNTNNTTYSSSRVAITIPKFLLVVLQSFLYMLPIYPFLAALVSFGFLFIITTFEFFHWPLEYLNNPIYYGTLYGPLSLIYWNVKKRLLIHQEHIPTLPS